jgi:hypothetical protein
MAKATTVEAPPPRTDPDDTEVSAAPHTDQLQGRDPRFAYQWVPTDRNHPQNVNEYLSPRVLRNGKVGKAWQLVHNLEGEEVIQPARRFADDGTGTDTVVRNRGDVLIAIPKEEHAKWEAGNNDEPADAVEKLLHAETKHYAGGMEIGGATTTAGFQAYKRAGE